MKHFLSIIFLSFGCRRKKTEKWGDRKMKFNIISHIIRWQLLSVGHKIFRMMIIILMGVTGSGKTTIGKRLAQELNWPFYDGDDFHPPANVEKMRSGRI
jgi:hypothetical protein